MARIVRSSLVRSRSVSPLGTAPPVVPRPTPKAAPPLVPCPEPVAEARPVEALVAPPVEELELTPDPDPEPAALVVQVESPPPPLSSRPTEDSPPPRTPESIAPVALSIAPVSATPAAPPSSASALPLVRPKAPSIGAEMDEAFAREDFAIEERGPRLSLSEIDAHVALKMSDEMKLRRAHLAKYVKGVVTVCVAVCMLAVVRKGAFSASEPSPPPATAAAQHVPASLPPPPVTDLPRASPPVALAPQASPAKTPRTPRSAARRSTSLHP